MTDSTAFEHTNGMEIAIIGMVGRFPGAKTIDAFWRNLKDGAESISFFSDDELELSGIDTVALNDPNYVKSGAILEDIDMFDAPFFGLNPKEAETMDPQHRVFLECAWEALENAGYNSEMYAGSIGVYAGVSMSTYFFNLYPNHDPLELAKNPQILIGNGKDYLATHISYKLNLDGPSINVQTACSTSLVAVHLACRGLLSGECDMALAGGVSINVPQKIGHVYQEGSVYSPDGHCRAFDARAQGTVFGNGVGIVVLKRLMDARADGDCIHAIIKGSSINNDGALKVGYTAPSVEGQAKVILAAQRMAEVEAETISYIEAHGTGTPLGDPIEIAALTQAFRATTQQRGFCAIGSVKTNIGHVNTAAGIAGLIKTVLALKHKQLPPSLNFERPNPNIDLANSPFYINTALVEWSAGRTPRRAGVSSFGVGGTNAHVVLEEAPTLEASGEPRPWHLLLLSAKTSSALETATANLVEHLKSNPDLNLSDVAYTLQVGRRAFSHRRMLVCRDHADALLTLEARDPQRVFTGCQEPADRSIVFMFPGGGTQYANMGLDLYQTEPTFREQVDRCADLLRPRLGYDLRADLYPAAGPSTEVVERLKRTSIALPTLFVVEYALARLWMSWGIRPHAMIGHSLGEYMAACLAGVFSLEDALSLVVFRAQLLDQLPSGAMLSVSLPADELRSLMNERLSLAAINGPSLCVVSGPVDAIDDMVAVLNTKDVGFRRLQIAAAGHSEMVTPILEPFRRFVEKLRLHAPQIPYVSNSTGTWITAAEATDPGYWAMHLRQTVRFGDGIRTLLKEPGRTLLEVGPGQTLGTLARGFIGKDQRQIVLASLHHPHDQHSDVAFLLKTLGQLWLAEIPVEWSRLYANELRHRLPLPTYSFDRQRYWIAPQKQADSHQVASGKKSDISDWFYIPSWKLSMPSRAPANQAGCWLLFADECGFGFQMVKRLEQEGHDVITVRIGKQFSRLNDRVYTINPEHSDTYNALFNELRAIGKIPQMIVHCWSITPNNHPRSGIDFLKHSQDVGYYSLLFICHALEKEGITSPLQMKIVSNYLYSVMYDEVAYPEKTTILGPCKVIPQEHMNITCQCIDIVIPETGTRQADGLTDQIIAEIKLNTSDRGVAYRGNQRWVQTFEPVRLDNAAEKVRQVRNRGVYVITGGLGNVGLVLAEHLARTAQARLVLIGRSGLPLREEWDQWLSTRDLHADVSYSIPTGVGKGGVRETPIEKPAHFPNDLGMLYKIQRVLALESLGAEVLVIGADVADEAQMQAAIAQAYARFGEIHGVIHSAGITSGKSIFHPIREIQRIESEWQFRPKVYGLYVLEQVLRGRALDFCVLISSNASILGGLGLVAYSAANIFMDAFAANSTKVNDIPWISTNWDGWPPREDTRQATVLHTSLDQYAMTAEESVDAFNRIVSLATVSQVAVSSGDLHDRLDLWIRRSSSAPYPEPVDESITLHPRPQLQSTYVAPSNEVERRVASIWQKLLGIEEVGINDNFFGLGGHSLMATQLMSRLRDAFQISLPLRTLFEAPTVVDLSRVIVQKLQLGKQQEDRSSAQIRRQSRASRAFPLSFAQQRLWFLDQLEPGSPFYSAPTAVRLMASLNLAALQRSLNEIVQRHETLRTTFATMGGQPVQVIAPAQPVTLPVLDLQALAKPEQEAEVLRLAGEEALRLLDLSRGPLMRTILLRLDQTEHVLLLTMHHIISDGWSIGVLIRELATLYDAFSTGKPSPLPELPIQYADFAHWQRAWLRGEVLEAQLAYWRQQLAGAPTMLALPTDRPRPAVQTFRGAMQSFVLPTSLSEALAALSQQEGATLFMTLLATFQALLYCYTSQEDLIVGTNVANRNRAETEGLIGFFVNMLVLRADVSGNPRFRELLGRVREVTLEAYAHQDLPFEQLVAELQPERTLSYAPLFQVVFTLQNAPMSLPKLPGLTLTPLKIASRTAKYDLVLNMVDAERGLIGSLEYNTDLFDAATAARMSGHFETLLRAVVLRPDATLNELAEELPEMDRQQRMIKVSAFKEARHQKFKHARRKTITGSV